MHHGIESHNAPHFVNTFSRLLTPELTEVFMESFPLHRITGEMRRSYVDQTRLLSFAMIGAIFATATLAFAAVRL